MGGSATFVLEVAMLFEVTESADVAETTAAFVNVPCSVALAVTVKVAVSPGASSVLRLKVTKLPDWVKVP